MFTDGAIIVVRSWPHSQTAGDNGSHTAAAEHLPHHIPAHDRASPRTAAVCLFEFPKQFFDP